MSTAISEFNKEVNLRVSGCPSPVVEHTIRMAAIEFCRRSRIWQEKEEDLITTVDGTSEYAVVSTSSEGEIAGIIELHYDDDNDTELPSITERELRDESSGWRTSEGKPTNYINQELGLARLYPIPDDAYDIDGTLWLTPNKTGTTLPDVLYDEWHEYIIAGAMQRILTIPKKEWTDVDLAMYYAAQFNQGVNKALSEVVRERTISSVTVRPSSCYSEV